MAKIAKRINLLRPLRKLFAFFAVKKNVKKRNENMVNEV